MDPHVPPLDRRKFMGLVGGSCVLITAAGLMSGCGETPQAEPQGPPGPPGPRGRQPAAKDAKAGTLQHVTTDVLVVGGGMAGVFAAVKAHDQGAKVVLVDKGAVGKSGQTPFARGIFGFDEERTGMTKEAYLERTAEASERMNNPAYTALLLDEGSARIEELRTWGFFDEACYADSLNRPLEERGIPRYERVTLTHLLKEDGRIAGAAGMRLDENEALVFRAKCVILCTGASGFKPAGWQIGSLTSDGDAMAYRVGAEITGKEWNDGHGRTNFGLEGLNHIVHGSQIHGMLGVEQNVEVSRNGPMASMGPPGGGPPVGHPPRGGPPGRGPPEGGRPPGPPPGGGREPPTEMGGASAGMSIHKAEGLFPADDRCASNVPGLFAAGDSLGSMQTGGIYTQVGSSLAGSAVQGAVAGEAAAVYAAGVKLAVLSKSAIAHAHTEVYAPLLRQRGFSPQWVTQALQGIMTLNFVLYVKSEERLKAALTYVEYLRDHQVPLLMANDLHELRQAHETANMILNAEMKLRASLMRKESRGSHYREDHPARDDDHWLAWIKIHRGSNGRMQLTRHPILTG